MGSDGWGRSLVGRVAVGDGFQLRPPPVRPPVPSSTSTLPSSPFSHCRGPTDEFEVRTRPGRSVHPGPTDPDPSRHIESPRSRTPRRVCQTQSERSLLSSETHTFATGVAVGSVGWGGPGKFFFFFLEGESRTPTLIPETTQKPPLSRTKIPPVGSSTPPR